MQQPLVGYGQTAGSHQQQHQQQLASYAQFPPFTNAQLQMQIGQNPTQLMQQLMQFQQYGMVPPPPVPPNGSGAAAVPPPTPNVAAAALLQQLQAQGFAGWPSAGIGFPPPPPPLPPIQQQAHQYQHQAAPAPSQTPAAGPGAPHQKQNAQDPRGAHRRSGGYGGQGLGYRG